MTSVLKTNARCRTSIPMAAARADGRRGSVILVVLVIVVMLSFSAYVFAELMLVEAQATALYSRAEQTRTFAESGIDFVAAQLAVGSVGQRPDVVDNLDLFQSVIVQDSNQASGQGRFSIVAPVQDANKSSGVRFGLADESAKLNLNALPLEKRKQRQARRMLMGLPKMTLQTADAILDFLDEDEDPREFGAESSYYSTLEPPYTSKNALLQSIDELLLARGVTMELLYGEDTNDNGWLDFNENDESASPPHDDGDGILTSGWNAFLTVNSRERNRLPNGRRKINVNQQSLAVLYDKLEREFGRQAAQFIVAFRLNGSIERQQELIDEIKKRRDGGFDVDGVSAEELEAEALERARLQRGSGVSNDVAMETTTAERGGLSLSATQTEHIRSLVDLFGASVRITIDGQDSVLDSPWTGDPSTIQTELPRLMDRLTISQADSIVGRINVNQAPYEILAGIPGMTEELARAIVAAQRNGRRQRASRKADGRNTVAWLVYEGLTDLATLRRIAPYLTTQGDVYRVYSMGYFERGAPAAFVEAIVDASQLSPKIISFRELAVVNAIEWELRKHEFLKTDPRGQF